MNRCLLATASRPALALAAALAVAACARVAPAPTAPATQPASSASPASRAAATPTQRTRVLVYNIRAGTDMAGEPNLARVADLVRATGADLVLLQEVDRGTARAGGVDQVAELERLTGFHGAFGRTLDFQGGEYGLAVLSRWPILSDSLVPLPVEMPRPPPARAYEPRGVLVVRVDAPGGVIGVLNTHLDHSRADVFRLQEVETVLRVAAGLRAAGPRIVIGGDLNAEPGTPVILRVADAGWTDAWPSCGTGDDGFTFRADAPVKRIDYLFLAPGLACQSARVIDTDASDHRPLLVRLSP